ncbi:hypothetical protein AAG906_027411 [Vitis piasezkii]
MPCFRITHGFWFLDLQLPISLTFSPVVKATINWTILSIATFSHWPIRQLDISNAFYMVLLIHIFIWSSPLAFKTLHIQTMCDLGFQASKTDSSLFILHQGALKFYVLIYVDDILLTLRLNQPFRVQDLGSLLFFLGIEAQFSVDGLLITQRKYITDLLTNSNMFDCKPCHTPMSTSPPLSKLFGDPLSNAKQYRQVASVGFGLFFSKHSTLDLQCFTDSDWGVYLGKILFHGLQRNNQPLPGLPPSEYRALANSTAKIMWLRSLLFELGLSSSNPATLWCDNVGAIYVCSNPVFHARTKHIELDYHFIREQVQQCNIQVHFISSDEIADILTKPLGQHLFVKHRDKLQLCSSPPSA